MSKKPAPNSRAFLWGLDPVKLVDLLDTHFDDDGGPKGSPYRRLYRETLESLLVESGAVAFAALLDEIDDSIEVETAMRQAGFVVGFETCRQLLLGELDVAALKGRA